MIAKVPAKRTDGKSSFKSLQKYMEWRDVIDPQSGEVIGWESGSVTVDTNCLHRETAWREMLAVADMNSRVKDPVYHAVLSWREGENPADEQAFMAARRAMKALGMTDHQYVAAIHRDTDNVHVHLMINRVHPEAYKSVYPDRDFYKLDKCMREVEIEQGWTHDRGPYAVHERGGQQVVDWAKEAPEQWRAEQREQRRVKQPTKARDMERLTGNESLHTYAQGLPQKDVQEALKRHGVTWQDLHRSLAKHGLELQPANAKQNAFRVHSKVDPDICIKASSMASELGGGKLVAKLGPWQAPRPEVQRELALRDYSDQRPKTESKRDPSAREVKRDERAAQCRELRDRYKAFTDEWKATRAPARTSMYEDQKQRRQAITETHKAQRQAIRTSGISTVEKKAFYSVAAFDTAAKRAALNEIIKAEREAFRKESLQSFREWTADRAQEGDLAAMRQIRGWAYQDKRTAKDLQRADELAERGPHLSVPDKAEHDPSRPRRVTDRVTWAVDRKTGAVDYKLDDQTAFRDSGSRIDYTGRGETDKDAIEAGLLLAREKFGGQAFQVKGAQDFRERVLETAIERGLDVRFSDPVLEQRRQVGRRQAERERPDWSELRGLAGGGNGHSASPSRENKEPPGQHAQDRSAGPSAAHEQKRRERIVSVRSELARERERVDIMPSGSITEQGRQAREQLAKAKKACERLAQQRAMIIRAQEKWREAYPFMARIGWKNREAWDLEYALDALPQEEAAAFKHLQAAERAWSVAREVETLAWRQENEARRQHIQALEAELEQLAPKPEAPQEPTPTPEPEPPEQDGDYDFPRPGM